MLCDAYGALHRAMRTMGRKAPGLLSTLVRTTVLVLRTVSISDIASAARREEDFLSARVHKTVAVGSVGLGIGDHASGLTSMPLRVSTHKSLCVLAAEAMQPSSAFPHEYELFHMLVEKLNFEGESLSEHA